MFEVQAHRGMPGFQAAIDAGVDVIECDLQTTKDGVVVIHHDFFHVPLTLAEINCPTLAELLQLVKTAPHTRLNLEIKYHPKWTLPPKPLAEKVIAVVRQYGLAARVYYSSFDMEVLAAVRAIDPNATIGLLFTEEDPQVILDYAKGLRASIFSPEHSYLTSKEQVRLFQEKGLRVIPWTVNEPKRWKELIEMGVDGMITDYPVSLIKLRERQI